MYLAKYLLGRVLTMKVPVVRSEHRPWGAFWVLYESKRFWIKLIEVKPGQCTSLQYHHARRELHIGLDRWHWRYIGKKARHSMHEGMYLELAWGRPREEDIVRITDMYGRV